MKTRSLRDVRRLSLLSFMTDNTRCHGAVTVSQLAGRQKLIINISSWPSGINNAPSIR